MFNCFNKKTYLYSNLYKNYKQTEHLAKWGICGKMLICRIHCYLWHFIH